MRHRESVSSKEALQAWDELRKHVKAAGGDPYTKPVLVKFLDTNGYEVMDRDIVEDEFYVRRRYKIVKSLDGSRRGSELTKGAPNAGVSRRKRTRGRHDRRR